MILKKGITITKKGIPSLLNIYKTFNDIFKYMMSKVYLKVSS